jgi:hypothetical protein
VISPGLLQQDLASDCAFLSKGRTLGILLTKIQCKAKLGISLCLGDAGLESRFQQRHQRLNIFRVYLNDGTYQASRGFTGIFILSNNQSERQSQEVMD